jgi:amylosucrase
MTECADMAKAAETPQGAPLGDAALEILRARLGDLYGGDVEGLMSRVVGRISAAADVRSEALKAIDAERRQDPQWVGQSGQTVYTFYVDRFAGDLSGLIERLDYLQDLGVRWLHPLPLLKARQGDSDGGFAVQDYREVEPALGDMGGLERLADELRARGMGLLLDVVCNHTAREHEWATRARAGDPKFRAFYHMVATEAEVQAWEETLVDVFPATAPGSFTYDEDLQSWVWTTFYPFQWDLNYSNPEVFFEMLDVLLFLANRGVQGFRLDSAPFLWKRKGTNCRSQPEAYAIIEAFRAALDLAAPGVLLLAEAIESLDDVLPFFGVQGRGCGLAYNNGVMTALWGALADQDVAVVRTVLEAASARPDHAAWLNYVRCHDDLIWNALSAYATPQDLERWSSFYGGQGFSAGRSFQTAPGGVPSTNGMTAALVGLGREDVDPDEAMARLTLLYGVIHALDGWPLIYMGDEIALGNDTDFLSDPLRAGEGRWLHRPAMDWSKALAARDGGAGAAAMTAIRRFGDAARRLEALNVRGRALPIQMGDPAVLAFSRTDGRPFLCLANFSNRRVLVELPSGFDGPRREVLSSSTSSGRAVELPPYGISWQVMEP